MDDGNNDSWAIANSRYKLVVNANSNEEMHDLANDPYELNDLLGGSLSSEEADAKLELEAELLQVRN